LALLIGAQCSIGGATRQTTDKRSWTAFLLLCRKIICEGYDALRFKVAYGTLEDRIATQDFDLGEKKITRSSPLVGKDVRER
jgi:hypothetical protein